MSCLSPLVAFPSKITENGKVKYIPIKHGEEYREWMHSKEWLKEKSVLMGNAVYYPIQIPCGKCIGCRLDYSRNWALRCMMELKTSTSASFLTITYNEREVPIVYYPNPFTGEAIPAYSLCLDDLKKFWKRLRKALPDVKIRYFACGEYGSNTLRPHYHAILFNYWPDDAKEYQKMDSVTYYTSDFLNKVWKKGNIMIGHVDFNSCAYVARYTAKKYMTVGDDFYESHNLEKPFIVMSRRPGIGWDYFESKKESWKFDKIYVDGSDPVDGAIPRSFIEKISEFDPELADSIKESRRMRGSVYERAIANMDRRPYNEILKAAEDKLFKQSYAILRNKV